MTKNEPHLTHSTRVSQSLAHFTLRPLARLSASGKALDSNETHFSFETQNTQNYSSARKKLGAMDFSIPTKHARKASRQ
jgi:hypothetical protein